MSFNVSEVPEWVLHYRNIWNETEWQLFENADNNTYNTTCFVPNLIPIRLRSHGLFLALFYLFLTSLIQQLLTAIEPWIAVYSSKCSLYKKKTKCFDKSILFIFRRFECHHTHYQGTAFRLKFQEQFLDNEVWWHSKRRKINKMDLSRHLVIFFNQNVLCMIYKSVSSFLLNKRHESDIYI